MGIKIFNSLPLELKSIENFKVFKKKTEKLFVTWSFFTLFKSSFVINELMTHFDCHKAVYVYITMCCF
jgi:hypothetical protein